MIFIHIYINLWFRNDEEESRICKQNVVKFHKQTRFSTLTPQNYTAALNFLDLIHSEASIDI